MNYISLGYFCSVASELERYGLRKKSFPFDWLISDFNGIMTALEEDFKDFWTYEFWAQNRNNRAYYKHLKYGFQFFHDFNKYQSFKEQISQIRKKYDRRIEEFKRTIQEPTVFIRYISDEYKIGNISAELLWIEEHYERIMYLLNSYNPQNTIMFIANEGVTSSRIKIYTVEKDVNDIVARFPFKKNKELDKLMKNVDFPEKKKNLKFYAKKKRKKIILKIGNKVMVMIKEIFLKEYHHCIEY